MNRLRGLRAWIVVAAILVGTAWVRQWWSAREELAIAQAAEAAGDLVVARERYQFAMRAYTPGAAAPAAAADALWRLAERAPTPDDALAALRRLRGAALSTRWLASPFGDRLPAVNARIATLMAEQQLASGAATVRGRDRAQLEADHARLLALDPMPAPGWSMWVVLSMFGWIGGAFLTIFRGFDAALQVQRRPLLRWGGFTLVCFGAWLVGLWQA